MKTQTDRNSLITQAKVLVEAGKGTLPKAANSMKTIDLEAFIALHTPATSQDESTPSLGRKVNPNSARQMRIAARAAAVEAGELRKGRKVDATSARQLRIAAREAAVAAGELKKGRPSNPNSARQVAIAAKAALIAAGTPPKKGRPVVEKPAVAAAPVAVPAKTSKAAAAKAAKATVAEVAPVAAGE
jgi:hypothetical protein